MAAVCQPLGRARQRWSRAPPYRREERLRIELLGKFDRSRRIDAQPGRPVGLPDRKILEIVHGHREASVQALHRNRRRLTTADAKRGNAALAAVTLQRVQQRHDEPRAGRADRMA